MNSPLNPALYGRLGEEFGRVVISQAGIAASTRYGRGYLLSDNKVRMEVVSAGEYYRVNCPYCGDSRGRLWINHMWGVPDDVTSSKNLWLAICYNENCLTRPGRAQELYERVYGFRNVNLRGRRIVILPGEVEEQVLKAVQPPGLLLPLDKLQTSDKVISYLRGRGFDPLQLQQTFGVSYCLNASADYSLAQDRIVIPVQMNGLLVGWQCRYAADINWKNAGIPKYYSRPNMPRRLMLYNYDNAIRFPFVVVCEGSTDVWNVGPYAVAAFGKQLSFPQIKLLCDNWKAIVILLDGDAWDDTCKLVEKLRTAEYKGPVIPVRLPEDKDPGDLDPTVNADFITGTANAMGVDLLNVKREDDDSPARSACVSDILGAIDQLRRLSDTKPDDYSFDRPRDAASRT